MTTDLNEDVCKDKRHLELNPIQVLGASSANVEDGSKLRGHGCHAPNRAQGLITLTFNTTTTIILVYWSLRHAATPLWEEGE